MTKNKQFLLSGCLAVLLSAGNAYSAGDSIESIVDQTLAGFGIVRPVEAIPIDNNEVAPTIVGGNESPLGARPYQVQLRRNGQHWCGGALLNQQWVLTAAHCLVDSNGTTQFTGLTVRVGVRDISSNEGQVINIAQKIPHASFSGNTGNGYDIALLKLASNAPANLTPIKLPTQSIMDTAGIAGSTVTVSGWGALSQGGGGPNILHEVDLPLVSNQTCNGSSAYNGQIKADMICAGLAAGGQDSCQGDSGGPLAASVDGVFYSMGVVSWGDGCAQPNKYGVYTRTFTYVNWVNSNMSGGSSSGGSSSGGSSSGGSSSGGSSSGGSSGGLNYCASTGGGTYEWIANVAVGGLDNASSTAAAYTDYTNLTANLVAGANAAAFTPGFASGSYSEHWAAWIDFNKDGDFTDAGEQVVSGLSGTAAVTTNITVPATASGTTRMRVSMKYNGAPTSSCGDIGDGEVEDYSVSFSSGGSSSGGSSSGGSSSGGSSSGGSSSGGSSSGGSSSGGSSSGGALSNGQTVTGLAATTGNSVNYYIDVPAGATNLVISIASGAGASGDADVYVKKGSVPTDSSYDCRPWDNGNAETCGGSGDALTTSQGRFYIRVKAYTSFTNVNLTASYNN